MSTRSPAVHSVHIYEDHSALIGRLCGIVSSGLNSGNAVLIIAASEYRDQLVKELTNNGVDIPAYRRDGRFTVFDARATLLTFMMNGMPDRDLFMTSVGAMLTEAMKSARNQERGLTVFGDMVAVLWDEGKKEAAIQLEALWNDALQDRAFHLHCAYPRSGFINPGDDAGYEAICRSHSHVVQ